MYVKKKIDRLDEDPHQTVLSIIPFMNCKTYKHLPC